MPLRIYLADLTHVGHGVATEAFPLNVGLIGSFLNRRFGNDVDIELFKYPQDLIEALRSRPPDVLGCSNYTWNSNLSYFVTTLAKHVSPTTLTVWGGTNYPFDAASQAMFLQRRPLLDMHVYYEGEQASAKLIERLLGVESRAHVFNEPIPGVQFLSREHGGLVTAPAPERLRELDEIPSPYTSGLLDKFFDGKLTPLIETTRGCPFHCNFCNAGARYFDRTSAFSDAYVKEELIYIAKKASPLGIAHVTMADNNFGMYPRDANTAAQLFEIQQSYGWPRHVTAWTGKNAKERVIEVTRLLGETLSISMSVQSMDREVLRTINRDTIKLDHYRAISADLHAQGRPQHTEVIMPLPGETLASHLAGLQELLDLPVSRVFSHTLQMLHGTPYKDDPAYVSKYGYQTKWRLVPLDFSNLENSCVFDTEEVAVATDAFGFEDYVEARKYLFIIDACFNSGLFESLKQQLKGNGVQISDWITAVYQGVNRTSGPVGEVYRSFARETVSELWDSNEQLVAHYSIPDNYSRLVKGEVGGNVLFKHRVWLLSSAGADWVRLVFRLTRPLLQGDASAIELDELERYTILKITDCFSPEGIRRQLSGRFSYDVLAWQKEPASQPLSAFRLDHPIELVFKFNARNIDVAIDGFRRYGTDLSGLIKLVQRSYFTFTRESHSNHSEPGRGPSVSVPPLGPGASSM